MAYQGVQKPYSRFPVWFKRVVVGDNGTAPVQAPFHIKPTSDPSGTLVEGDVWFGDTENAPKFYNGSANRTLATLEGTQAFTGNLSAAGDVTFSKNSGTVTIGTTDPVVITHGTNSITLATGDTLAITTADKLTVGGIIVPATVYESFTIRPHATITEYDLMIAHRAIQVTAIKMVPSTLQGGALTGTVVKATGTATPVKTTTPMVAADALDFNAGAYTVVTPALTATGADLILAAGDRIGIDFSAALTAGLATITIAYKYV